MTIKYLLFLILLFPLCTWGQTVCPDRQIVEDILNEIKGNKEHSLLVPALHLLNTPYVASTLEINDDEQLIVNLRELDCMTFVDNCIALQLTAQSDSADFNRFRKNLQTIRYRKGIINGYPSRLHYTSDWIDDNVKKGLLENKTQTYGGIICPLYVDFMSTHPESYPHLSKHPEEVEMMREVEKAINQRTHYYIPKEKISENERLIQTGDIICFVTSVKGLDISHLGIAYRQGEKLTFIHASSTAKKVIINQESLNDYCQKIKSNKGLMIVNVRN